MHAHKVHEWLIVYEGSFEMEINGEIKLLRKGDYVYIKPNSPHSVLNTLADSWFIAITVPADEGFPDA